MSNHIEMVISRRQLLQMAAAVVPASFASRFTLAIWRSELDGPRQQQRGSDLLALGASEVVAHIRNGDVKVEAYVAQLLKQYHAHKDLNLANAIDETRLLEQARAVDQSRAR